MKATWVKIFDNFKSKGYISKLLMNANGVKCFEADMYNRKGRDEIIAFVKANYKNAITYATSSVEGSNKVLFTFK